MDQLCYRVALIGHLFRPRRGQGAYYGRFWDEPDSFPHLPEENMWVAVRPPRSLNLRPNPVGPVKGLVQTYGQSAASGLPSLKDIINEQDENHVRELVV